MIRARRLFMLPHEHHPDREPERIARVYRGYSSPERARMYDPANPGNRAITAERVRRTRRLLETAGLGDLRGRRVLDVGCGFGHELARMRDLGVRDQDLVGVDLMRDRVEEARLRYPTFDIRLGDAAQLDFADESFDVVLSFTVMSSVLSEPVARRIASEMMRVLRPGGAVVWYDLRMDSPGNPDVRGLPVAAVRRLFADAVVTLSSITLAPPLARRLGRLTPVAYPVLARLPPLRTHLIGLLRKSRSPSQAPPPAIG
jgi:ubiquinone/menaquinone biosynthesis C-methylase UbiE